jgi:protein-tyrosine phosphatase
MAPLVDMHCHLLAGLDDGPRTMETAVDMCAMAYEEGVRLMAATAHQSERWSGVTPDCIRDATRNLHGALRDQGLPLVVFPCAEVMAQPETPSHWQMGRLLSVADRGQFLLLEMPRGVFVDLLPTARRLRAVGIRPILAHPEREPDFLHEPGMIEDMIEAGCLVQVSSASITDPKTSEDRHSLKSWFRRGIVHLLGSDGHSLNRRAPRLAAAYQQVARWVGVGMADRIASTNGLAIAQGRRLRICRPLARSFTSWWVPKLW